MSFQFGFDKWILVVNGIKETGWFRITRFRSLKSKPTFLSVIISIIIIITHFSSFMGTQKCLEVNQRLLERRLILVIIVQIMLVFCYYNIVAYFYGILNMLLFQR